MNTACHVAKITRKHGDKVYTSHLLRRSVRKDGKVKHETLANLSHLPAHAIETLRRSLAGETLLPAEKFRTKRSRLHGHVEAVLGAARKLGLDALLGSKPSRQRDLVMAMVVQRILFPCSKLATTRHWKDTTLAQTLGVEDADKNELYRAMDWLLGRQQAIEKKLATRHLGEASSILYDVSSSYYEGETCPLARFGHDRDGKKGKLIIVYGLLTDAEGRPIAIDVHPGNTADPTTVPMQTEKLRKRFGLKRIVLVGDRGMLTQTRIDTLAKHPGLGWLSALRSGSIRQLLEEGSLERSLFDETHLAEIESPEFPNERLIACFNPLLADRRAAKREDLLRATERKLDRIVAAVARRTRKPLTDSQIGLRAGKIIDRHRMAKHFTLTIEDGRFAYRRNEQSIRRECQLDGIYVIRTSEPKKRLSAPDAVRGYKGLARVERAFRCLKGIDLMVRPIRHRVDPRVRAHFLICMLAYYVEWALREAWKPLLFADEELSYDRQHRDPVAPADPSESAKRKKRTQQNDQGRTVHDFRSLLTHLSTRCSNLCEIDTPDGPMTFEQLTVADDLQAEALRLLGLPI